MGCPLFVGFWYRNHSGHDVHHRCHRAAFFLRGIQIRVAQSGTNYRFRLGESGFRPIYLLPHWHGRWSFHQSPHLDAQLTYSRAPTAASTVGYVGINFRIPDTCNTAIACLVKLASANVFPACLRVTNNETTAPTPDESKNERPLKSSTRWFACSFRIV